MSNEAGSRRRVAALVALSITQLISWGTLYYALPVASADISRDKGWPPVAVTGALTLALLISAALSIPVGHALARFGPRVVMSIGAALAALALGLIAHAETLTEFRAGWVVAGVAASMTLYPPAFVAATQWFTPSPFRALTIITIFGALASTAKHAVRKKYGPET